MDKGFTLIEVIIVICIMLLLLGIIWPIGANFYRQQLLNKSQQQIVWILKLARANAVNQKNNSAFGVYLNQAQATLFQGLSYDTRNISEDINYSLPKAAAISGLSVIVFAPNTGFVSEPGSITLSASGLSKEIVINKLGVIDY